MLVVDGRLTVSWCSKGPGTIVLTWSILLHINLEEDLYLTGFYNMMFSLLWCTTQTLIEKNGR